MNNPIKFIHLWSGPRNISTALMYSFSQRNDTKVVDEPLYAHYLHKTGIDHPGRDETLKSQPIESELAIKNLLSIDTHPVVFAKHMTHHLLDIDKSFMQQAYNILLIRHPAKVLTSYSKVIESPVLEDIGIQETVTLYKYLEAQKVPTIIIDGDELKTNPEKHLKVICNFCQIEWNPAMLKWNAGPISEDGVWAKFWYAKVHQSIGFEAPQEESTKCPPHLQPVLDEAMPHFNFLSKINSHHATNL